MRNNKPHPQGGQHHQQESRPPQHYPNMPNMQPRMFHPGNYPFAQSQMDRSPVAFPAILPESQLFRPPEPFYSPRSSIMGHQPANMTVPPLGFMSPQMNQRVNNKPHFQAQHHQQEAWHPHYSRTPNMQARMFHPGNYPFTQPEPQIELPMSPAAFPLVLPQRQLFRPPESFYSPGSSIMGHQPANVTMPSLGFGPPLIHSSHTGVPLSIPPVISNLYRGDIHQRGVPYHKRLHDERIDNYDYQPIDKKSRFSNHSRVKPQTNYPGGDDHQSSTSTYNYTVNILMIFNYIFFCLSSFHTSFNPLC